MNIILLFYLDESCTQPKIAFAVSNGKYLVYVRGGLHDAASLTNGVCSHKHQPLLRSSGLAVEHTSVGAKSDSPSLTSWFPRRTGPDVARTSTIDVREYASD